MPSQTTLLTAQAGRLFLYTLGLAALLTTAACSDDSGPTGCKRDSEAIAERRACQSDEDCPCGAGCVLGLCQAACSADDDCSDGWCDRFGRCRPAGDNTTIAPLATASPQLIRLPSPTIQVPDSTVAEPLRITVQQGQTGELRVAADEGARVTCTRDGSFGADCRLKGVAGGSEQTVWVKLDSGVTDPVQVRVYYGDQLSTASVVAQTSAPAPQTTSLTAGRYSGSISLVDVGTGSDPQAAGQAQDDLAIPVQANVHIGTPGVLALEDPLELLVPGGKWIGRLIPSSTNSGKVALPRLLLISGELTADAETEVLLAPEEAAYSATSTTLAFELVTRFEGVLMGQRRPQARWRVVLSRVSDLPAGAVPPSVPADATAKLVASRGLTATKWEAALAHAATPDASRVFSLTDSEKRAFLDVFGRKGQSGSLEVCNLGSTGSGGLALFALEDGWGCHAPGGAQYAAPATLIASGRPLVAKLAFGFSDKATVSVSSSMTSTTQVRALPCKVAFSSVNVTFKGSCGADEQAAIDLGTMDTCTQMAAAYGCVEEDVTAGSVTVSAAVGYTDGGGCTRTNGAVTISGSVSRVCRLPVVPAPCAELALCFEPPSTGVTSPDSVIASLLDPDNQLSVSGDLKCLTGNRSAAIAMDVNAELPVTDANRLDVTQLLKECADDLDAIEKQSAPLLKPYAEGLQQGLPAAKCMQAARLLYAIGLATEQDRQRALSPDEPEQALSTALANRLIQRWLLHHAFIAREAAESERMAQVLRNTSAVTGLSVPDVETVLTASLKGWQLLLHPRFATAVDQMPASVLVSPDYRQIVAGKAVSQQPSHQQSVALPVTMLETLLAQLSLVEPGLERAALKRDTTALKTLASVMHHLVPVRALAAELAARSETYAKANNLPEPAWLARYKAIAANTKGLVGRLVSQARAIQLGENPLGIRADDTPLYFLGDEQSATRRFSAISDFIIGTGPGSTWQGSAAWAPAAVKRADDALEDARTAWLAKRDREILVAQSQSQLASKLDGIRASYGDRLAQLCGTPAGLSTNDLLEKWPSFDENTCHLRSSKPACAVDPEAYAALMTADQVAYQMCVVAQLRAMTADKVSFVDPEHNTIAEAIDSCTPSYPVACKDGSKRCLTCGSLSATVTPDTFRQIMGLGAIESDTIQRAQDHCKTVYPGVDTSLPGLDDLASSPAGLPDCYSGSIGDAVFEVRSAATDLETARSKLADLKEAYALAMNNCIVYQVKKEKTKEAKAAHKTTMAVLRSLKLAADIAGSLAGGVKDCAGTLDFGSTISFGAKSGVICSIVAVKTAADVTSKSLDFSMKEAEREHAKFLAKVDAWVAKKQCFNDAELKLVGVRTAAMRIKKALLDLDKANFRLRDRQRTARRYYDDGRAALAAAKGRAVPPLAHDLWLDDKIDAFLREMRLARRLLYLAVKAVEYETQQSLAYESTVLTATKPAELQTVLDKLLASAATRGVGGKRPTELKVVLSLRKELLQLADRSDLPASEQNLTDVQRFRLLLTDRRFAVYDSKGSYKGQRIPFAIAPLQALELGEAMGIPVLAGSDCAERLWSVNASLLGKSSMYQGASPPTFARIELHKQNTFYSQWCDASGQSEAFQVASVRPSNNLFADPVYGGEHGSGLGASNEAQQYTTARIEAYFNVERTDFEADTYANGETSELAARGLYGRYALFFPAEVLSLKGSEGLVLNQVDDVLLRLDYVSVAR